MIREIVVFETNQFNEDDPAPRLDFRLLRGAVPGGVSPLAIADRQGFAVACGQHFSAAEVAAYAEQQSGYAAACLETVTISGRKWEVNPAGAVVGAHATAKRDDLCHPGGFNEAEAAGILARFCALQRDGVFQWFWVVCNGDRENHGTARRL